jgi:MFS family permease
MAITTFSAFKSRNYRLFFAGQSISLIGTWMQRTAVSWVVYSLTHSTYMLGLSIFATQFPSFLLSLFGGVISDRYNRYKVLLYTQALSLIQAILLALLVFSGIVNVWAILCLSSVLGIINAFDVPARHALMYDMVDKKEDLPNALALNSSMVNLGRLIGPAISGIVLEYLGAAFCFSINAFSFLAVLASLLLMKLPAHKAAKHKKRVFVDLKEGLVYLKRTPSISAVILMLAFMSFFVLPFNTLLPVYAKIIFKGSATTFGYINSFIGLGAIAGTFFLASLKPGANLRTILIVNTLIFGVGLVLFSYSHIFSLSMLFAVVCGFGMMSQTTICNTIIQTAVSLHMRGRVISYFAMAFFGMMPLGSLLIGIVSRYLGAPMTILSEGILALIIAFVFAPYIRKNYLEKQELIGMLKEEQEELEII